MTTRHRILSHPRFLLTSVIGSLVFGLIAALTPLAAQIAALGVFVSILAGLILAMLDEQARRDAALAELGVLGRAADAIAHDGELASIYRQIAEAFVALAAQPDAVLRSAAVTKLLGIANELGQMADGVVWFRETEAWRAVYDELLHTKELATYRSVAWVTTPNYWQDTAGKQSIRANYDAINRGLLIERLFILPDELWRTHAPLPAESVLSWIMEQHNHGVWVMLCRERDISQEPDLPLDFGIYGERAVGVQSLDDRGRTQEFRLQFGKEAVKIAEDRWRRLKLHATPLRTLLDAEDNKA